MKERGEGNKGELQDGVMGEAVLYPLSIEMKERGGGNIQQLLDGFYGRGSPLGCSSAGYHKGPLKSIGALNSLIKQHKCSIPIVPLPC